MRPSQFDIFPFLTIFIITSLLKSVLIYPFFQKTRQFILSGLIFFCIFVKIYIMEKRSTHWADVLNWLKTVVDSCKTTDQVEVCERLIRNYERMYENQLGVRECMDLLRPLKHQLWDVSPLSFNEKMKKLQVL